MSVVESLQKSAVASLTALFGQSFTEKDFQVNQTKPEFEGDYTIVLFSLVKSLKLSPDAIGTKLGDHLVENNPLLFTKYNIISGFLNLTVADAYWMDILSKHHNDESFGKLALNGKKVMVEYSSPNTNKPLHLGHLRNNFLGWSVAEIFKASGYEVIKSCIVNDRGIHICKSMIAWQKWGNGETPESTGTKGDHFVGDYYVKFEQELKRQSVDLIAKENNNDFAHYTEEEKNKVIELSTLKSRLLSDNNDKNKEKIIKLDDDITEIRRSATDIMKEAKQMLFDWEAGKPEVIALWAKMNSWVYSGFDITYKTIGSDFNKTYYESNTYLLGKKIVAEGLQKNVFIKEEDNSVWIDLTADGLDKKIVQRKDGTSVYITQDIGLAQQKYEEYGIDQSIYVIGDEQNYHMKVLKLIAEKLQLPNAENIYHLSYGMVELPTGKMKSREGTVVDADDIVEEMEKVAQEKTEELGKVKDFTAEELAALYHTIGLGALKFFLLRVDPKKKMIFNPEESIDFHGFTGPFIQFNHARIKSILRKSADVNGESIVVSSESSVGNSFLPLEKELVVALEQYPTIVTQACSEMNPSAIAIYVYHIAKTFSSFYTEHSIANAETEEKKQLRLQLAAMTANVIKSGMNLMGVEVPERM
ncbi:arginine--tRNA ligase [Ferruginibacter sp. SUN106]|uniref:arginine--tRNA ligase n=1 Tax=Ferruginibacter sp. SUN106 TaxID=2978348 RepID=UPI003D36EEF5